MRIRDRYVLGYPRVLMNSEGQPSATLSGGAIIRTVFSGL